MKPIDDLLRSHFQQAIGLAFGVENVTDPLIKTGDPRHADYQANVAMALSKKLGKPPREVAQAIVLHVKPLLAGMCEEPQIAGPGFINLRLKKEWLSAALATDFAAPGGTFRAGVSPAENPQTIVVDYSGPNIAKQMHVGHLRSTIIGDTLARTLSFLGHHVVRQNHVGDFGTQFGMLIRYAREKHLGPEHGTHIGDLDAYYKEASARDKADPAFAKEAREAVVALQTGEPAAVALWQWIVTESRRHYTEIYKLLNVTLVDADERGESFYKDRLPGVVAALRQALEVGGEGASVRLHGSARKAPQPWEVSLEGVPAADAAEAKTAMESKEKLQQIAEAGEAVTVTKPFIAESEGALCVFLPGYVDQDKKPLPLIVQKSDGAFLYATTDLAAIHFRVQEPKTAADAQRPRSGPWHADRIIYTTDARQAQHFAMVFDTARAVKWNVNPVTHQTVSLEHAPFGSILGEDGKPFKTRSGESVKLKDLLDEAVQRARDVAASKAGERGVTLSDQQLAVIAPTVGIGAVKYADLKSDRAGDYIFAWDRMLALEGNTGPYLQYAYARISSIFRKAGTSPEQVRAANPALLLETPQEQALAKKLLQFGGVVESVARDLKPHYLCAYLYELASSFSNFYEACRVNDAATPELKASRLALCDLTARTLRIGLQDLLGINVLEEM